jgi:hypothetical protein
MPARQVDGHDFFAVYDAAREAVEHQTGQARGDVLILPFTSYRAPDWNRGHKVLDPMGRYLTADYVASDRLLVSGHLVEGEDPTGPAIRRALQAGTPSARSRLLAGLGIGLVVVERDTGQKVPAVAGRSLLELPELSMIRVEHARAREVPTSWLVAMAVAWAGFLLTGVTNLLVMPVNRARRRRSATPGRCYSRRRT